MDQKIRELTDKIFNEGVEKGREEADKILAEAQKKSMEMLEDARREAEAIHSSVRPQSIVIRKVIYDRPRRYWAARRS